MGALTITKRIRMSRGQTFSFIETVRDEVTYARVSLAGKRVHWVMRADMKVAPSVRLTSQDPLPDGWRAGVEILDQTGEHVGDYRVTVTPSDTSGLVALGADDPWYHESWIEDDTEDDSTAGRYPHITASVLDLMPQVLDPPVES